MINRFYYFCVGMLTAMLLCVLTSPAHAKVVAKADGQNGSILLSDEKCPIAPYHMWHMVDLTGKKIFEGCWFMYGTTFIFLEKEGQVLLLDKEQLSFKEGA